MSDEDPKIPISTIAADSSSRNAGKGRLHPMFWAAWRGTTALLIASILLAAYAAVWEYSTRRYLAGFADAVVPASATAEGKIEAILDWMAQGPSRMGGGPPPDAPVRDPIETLNYASLLWVCGSTTNAFINLADSVGLSARRLLLLDSRGGTKHVVSEVRLSGRWIIVDPSFRMIPRGPQGAFLTRRELANPAVFSAVLRPVAGYDPSYTYDRTAHVRILRLPVAGNFLRKALPRVLPGWQDSAMLSLILERRSLATLVLAAAAVLILSLVRGGLRWYGRARFGIRTLSVRARIYQAWAAFFRASDGAEWR